MSGILVASGVGNVYFPDSSITAYDFALSPNDALASIAFYADGSIRDHNGSYRGYWISPDEAANSSYYMRANSASPGTPDSGIMDTWLQLNTTRLYYNEMLGIGVDSDTFTVEIARGAGTQILSIRNITVTAEVDV